MHVFTVSSKIGYYQENDIAGESKNSPNLNFNDIKILTVSKTANKLIVSNYSAVR